MSVDTVKLTVQIQSHDNRKRFTIHDDVPVSEVAAKAESIARDLCGVLQKQKRDSKAATAGVGG